MSTKIVLIVGPSGVGKDTLLKEVKKLLSSVNFIQRYITRKPDYNESNYYLDEYAFEILKNSGFFISTWNAHGNYYGIAKNSITSGLNIISISRSKIKDFESYCENVYTINITVTKEILRKRLESRNRESSDEIEKRLNRSYETIDAKNLINFDNSDTIENSVKKLFELLNKIESE